MADHTAILRWIDAQHERMTELVTRWSNINSAAHNIEGLKHMRSVLAETLSGLGGTMNELDLEPQQTIDAEGRIEKKALGRTISVIARPDAPRRIMLCFHMDTVYSPDHPVDTLGPRGGNLHSDGEYLRLVSLTERAKLSAPLLLKLANNEVDWPAASRSAQPAAASL